MTKERMEKIKKIFQNYSKNVTALNQLERPGINGPTYGPFAGRSDSRRNGVEQMVIAYLIDKEKIEKEIAVVDKTYSFFADDRDVELASLIDLRYRKGCYHWQAVDGVYISDRQGIRWLEKAYEKAEEIALQLHII